MTTIKKQTKKWKMRGGKTLRICDMSDSHIEKVLQLLYRWAKVKQYKTDYFYIHCVPPTGDMAQLAFEEECNRVWGRDWTDYLPAIFDNLWLESRRRRIRLARPLCFYYTTETLMNKRGN